MPEGTQPPMGGYDRPVFAAGQPGPSRRRRLSLQAQFLLFSLVVLAGVGLVAYRYLRPAPSRYVLDSYQYAVVERRDFRDLIVSAGTVVPDTVIAASAPLAVQVQAVGPEAGDDVRQGDVLLELASVELVEELDRVEGELDAALIELEKARLQAERDRFDRQRELTEAEQQVAAARERLPLQQALFDLGGISRLELEQAAQEVEQAQARVESATQALSMAERQAELTLRQAEQKVQGLQRQREKLLEQQRDLTVRAELDGRVLSVSARPGEHVERGGELLRYADITRQHVETAVAPSQAALVEPGTRALLRLGNRAVPAAVAFVAPQATSGGEGATVPVRLALSPEVAAGLWPYAELSVELELGVRRDRPALRRGPFFASGDASFVYVISEDGRRAERREVRYGAIDGEAIEVLEGLEPGDRIVYSSYSAFRTFRSIELAPEGGRPVGLR